MYYILKESTSAHFFCAIVRCYMGKKKYSYFNPGDLLLTREILYVFQRDAYGKRTILDTILPLSKILYLDAKICPSTGAQDYNYNTYWRSLGKPITIKFFHLNTVWYCQVQRELIYSKLKLLIKA